MEEVSKKVQCKSENCQRMILELTAQKTGGYCYPCYNTIQAEKREEYIRKNRRDVNLYEGINDNVEILKIMHKDKEYDPLIRYIEYPKSKEEVYNLLSKDEVNKLKEYAFKLYDEEEDDDDEWEQILLHLVCLKNAEINDFLKILVNDNEISMSSLFINASDEIAQLLIDKLDDNKNSLSINQILKCLAAIGNERVVKLFASWKKSEPDFAQLLYIKPYEYSYNGGFIIDENEKRKNLYYDKSYTVRKGRIPKCNPVSFYENDINNREENNNKNIKLNDRNRISEKCGWCKKDLTSLFTIDLKDDEMKFLGFNGDKLKISTCSECTYYDTVFTDIDTEGNAYWSKYNKENEEEEFDEDDYEDIEEDENNKIYLDTAPKSADYGSDYFLDVRFTKIGGKPTWIQDAYYPKCPKCGEDMMFIGQVCGEDIDYYAEGIIYGFVCKKCMIAATTYQQT